MGKQQVTVILNTILTEAKIAESSLREQSLNSAREIIKNKLQSMKVSEYVRLEC